jgi:hypothetical protein
VLNLEHIFSIVLKLGHFGESEIPWKFGNVVLEKDGD